MRKVIMLFAFVIGAILLHLGVCYFVLGTPPQYQEIEISSTTYICVFKGTVASIWFVLFGLLTLWCLVPDLLLSIWCRRFHVSGFAKLVLLTFMITFLLGPIENYFWPACYQEQLDNSRQAMRFDFK